MGGQKFNFTPKFYKMGDFQPQAKMLQKKHID